jgi:hemerythrin-like domain-containing protein
MRRDHALVRLSRDHHRALVVAQGLGRATEATLTDAVESFRSYWKLEGAEHLAAEEQILLPLLAQQARQGEQVVGEVLIDHLVLRRQADRLLAAGEGSDRLEQVRALGAELAEHVRREERVLFPLVERVVSTEELAELADRLEHAQLHLIRRSEDAPQEDPADRWLGLNYLATPGPGDSEGG